MYGSGFDLLNTFLEFSLEPVRVSCTKNLIKRTILSHIIQVLLIVPAVIFKGTPSCGCFSEWMSVTKNFRELTEALWNSCCDEALQENICDKAFFKKSSLHSDFL